MDGDLALMAGEWENDQMSTPQSAMLTAPLKRGAFGGSWGTGRADL